MIRFTNVKKTYENGTRAVKGISMLISNGEFVFLVGPSGSGKSTILKMLTGEESITEGSIVADGFDLSKMKASRIPYLRRKLGVVFQDIRLIEKKTVAENLEFAMRVVSTPQNLIGTRVEYVLDLVGLADKKDSYPRELSGGEQQRIAIARALVNNPSTILADEPTGNLDPDRSLEIMLLLERINQLGTTIVVVTHEQHLVDQFNKRVINLEEGQIVSDQENGCYDYEKK